MPGLSRRKLLLGGVGAAAAACAGSYELVQGGTLPGKYALDRLLGACGSAPSPPAGPLPSLHSISFYSAYRQQTVQMVMVTPAGLRPDRLSAVVALHGSGSNAAMMAVQVRPALARSEVTHVAIICVDGGETYWHKRADGDDPAGMIVHEVLPRAAAAGLRTNRLGITGQSMGGYGALLLSERLSPAAVAALSPAIYATYGDARAANPRAFDSAADFAGNDVFTDIAALRHVPTWVACGTDDPFEPEVAKFRAALAAEKARHVPGGFQPGCHDDAFWLRNMPAALQFIGAHLS